MRDTELASAATSTSEPSPTARHLPSVAAMLERVAARAGLKRGFVDDARRAATPHVIDCVGLSRENLGDEPYRFEREFQERRAWCGENGGLYEIEAIRDDETRAVTGYRFRFAGFQRRRFSSWDSIRTSDHHPLDQPKSQSYFRLNQHGGSRCTGQPGQCPPTRRGPSWNSFNRRSLAPKSRYSTGTC